MVDEQEPSRAWMGIAIAVGVLVLLLAIVLQVKYDLFAVVSSPWRGERTTPAGSPPEVVSVEDVRDIERPAGPPMASVPLRPPPADAAETASQRLWRVSTSGAGEFILVLDPGGAGSTEGRLDLYPSASSAGARVDGHTVDYDHGTRSFTGVVQVKRGDELVPLCWRYDVATGTLTAW
jgi:hypothetical protein